MSIANEKEILSTMLTAFSLAGNVLVIAPHPDDEVFGCGGTLALLQDRGSKITTIVVTNGARGGVSVDDELVNIRTEESRAAAKVLGINEPLFWGLADRGVKYGEVLIGKLRDAIMATEAALVFLPSPADWHPDHQAIAFAGAEAVRRLGGERQAVFYEVTDPLPCPNMMHDISSVDEKKQHAMHCFSSQLQEQPYAGRISGINSFRALHLGAKVISAEAFTLLTASELDKGLFTLLDGPLSRRHRLGFATTGDDLPLVSVIIRSMDRPTLRDALDSLALQTYTNIEVVLVNANGAEHQSTDKWHEHFPVNLIEVGAKMPRSRAANRGLDAARGEYLIFLDDDDWFDAGHVQKLVDAIRLHPEFKVVYTGVKCVDEKKNPLPDKFFTSFDALQLVAGNFMPIHAVLFSRNLLGLGCRMDESLNLYEDWDFWIQLSRQGDFLRVDGLSAVYRIAQQSGFGVQADPVVAERAALVLYKKWFSRLSDRQVTALMQAVRQDPIKDKQITLLNKEIAERDGKIAERDRQIAERDRQIADFKQRAIQHAEALKTIKEMRGSSSWKLTSPLRKVASKIKNFLSLIKLLPNIFRFGGGVTECAKKAWLVFLREGWRGVKRRILFVGGDRTVIPGSKIRPDMTLPAVGRHDYVEWVRRYDTLSDVDMLEIKLKIETVEIKPLISVVMPVYNPPIPFLDEAIQSVRNQLYPNWELCIADDASSNPEVRVVLERHSREDERVKVVFRESNGHISRASNSALELVQGEFIALLDHDDLLAEQALYWVVDAINQHPDVGLIYSDEDKVDKYNHRYDPYFKCDLNYELLLAQNMVSHLGVYRTGIVRRAGGFRVGFEGSQDYDLLLRIFEKLEPGQIVHISRVLYHWRAIEGSTALASGEKSYAVEAGRKAVAEHLKRVGLSAEVLSAPEAPTLNRVRFTCPSPHPLVSLLIPTRDRADLLGMCLDTLVQRTTYQNYEVIIIDNGSIEASTRQLFARLPRDRFRILRDDAPFNFAALNNKAAQVARGELLCLMNNDIEILTPDWLEEMVSFASRQEVGCVGARLWYPDGGLQHGGVLLGVGGVANHAHYRLIRGNPGYFGRALLHQSFSAVTGACLLVRRNVFDEVDGLDEQLGVAFNDVDFCLRVREAGYRNVWTPYAEMNHHESASRGFEDTPEKQRRFAREVRIIQSRWGNKLRCDPAYSVNLTLDYEDFSYAWPPRNKSI